ncbi:high-affinity iron permease [Ceratobasidium sp. 392]|nr:high-affinity iron permease [Ceratobasidium sp. 392]
MAKNLFSVPIFFILLRESLEASIIVSVLLSLVEQIVNAPTVPQSTSTDRLAVNAAPPAQGGSSTGPGSGTHTPGSQTKDAAHSHDQPAPSNANDTEHATDTNETGEMQQADLLRRLRWQIILGAGSGFLLALVIGAAFIAVWFIKVVDLFSAAEEIWEGVFSLIASILILVMGLAMLRMDRAKAKWRRKLEQAFNAKNTNGSLDHQGKAGIRMLFMLPFVTVLREGLEAVVFVGGVGGDVAEAGNGPGSYDVVGNIWHLDCCNPESKHDAKGWAVFNAILGWSNNGSIGTVLSYILYWLVAIVALVRMKHREGRTGIVKKAAHYTRFSTIQNAIRRRRVEIQRRHESQEISS